MSDEKVLELDKGGSYTTPKALNATELDTFKWLFYVNGISPQFLKGGKSQSSFANFVFANLRPC